MTNTKWTKTERDQRIFITLQLTKLNFMTDDQDAHFIARAIELAKAGMERGDGGPFGAVIVKDGEIIGEGNNQVTSSNDPTAHAEIVAIRNACKAMGSFQLTDCTLYTSCEPCPMCLGAIYWARPERVVFACSRKDAAMAGFDDDYIYREIPLPISERTIPMSQVDRDAGKAVFDDWNNKSDKVKY